MTSVTIEQVLSAMGQGGNDYLTEQVQPYFDDVMDFVKSAGVPSDKITVALIVRGISDVWDYVGGTGKLSPYFIQRVTQLSYRG